MELIELLSTTSVVEGSEGGLELLELLLELLLWRWPVLLKNTKVSK